MAALLYLEEGRKGQGNWNSSPGASCKLHQATNMVLVGPNNQCPGPTSSVGPNRPDAAGLVSASAADAFAKIAISTSGRLNLWHLTREAAILRERQIHEWFPSGRAGWGAS